MSGFKKFTRNPLQVLAKIYEPGDEDGFLVERSNGKQAVVTREDKNYDKYTERCDFLEIVPYIWTESGPSLIFPDSYVVIDMTTSAKTAMDASTFERLHTEGDLSAPRIILPH